jgi:hypothetical protein
MLWLSEAAVHTTGINWASVLTIICSVCVVVGGLIVWVSKQISNNIAIAVTSAIDKFHLAVVNVLDTRLTKVEGKQDSMNIKLEDQASSLRDLKNTRGRDKSNDPNNGG